MGIYQLLEIKLFCFILYKTDLDILSSQEKRKTPRSTLGNDYVCVYFNYLGKI